MTTKSLLLTLLVVAASAQLRGVNYGIQKPDGSCTGPDDVLADFKIIATFAQAVKIYNMAYCNGAANTLAAAAATGLKIFLGMQAAPDSAWQGEKTILQQVAAQYTLNNVIGITVGSEDLYRQSVAASQLASEITEVKNIIKQLGYTTPVTHVDVYSLQPAEIMAVADIVMFNAFPFWEGVDANSALATMQSHYTQVLNGAGGKTVWIGETGWPSGGATQANAEPSSQNQQKWLNDFICWANANGIPYFWFEAFDEPWKQSDENGAIEVSFGLYKSDRTRKAEFTLSCASPAPSPALTATPVSNTESSPALQNPTSATQPTNPPSSNGAPSAALTSGGVATSGNAASNNAASNNAATTGDAAFTSNGTPNTVNRAQSGATGVTFSLGIVATALLAAY